MTKTSSDVNGRTGTETFNQSLERTIARLRGGALGTAVAGSMTLASALGISACGGEQVLDHTDPGKKNDKLGKQDWAQYGGERNPALVTYLNSNWHEYTNCNSRFGCQNVDVFLKLQVKKVDGADLSQKRVGVIYHIPGSAEATALGDYFTDLGGGFEEWHVRVSMYRWDMPLFEFNAWYQDGAGHTYYDDNNGELFPVAYEGSYAVIRENPGATQVAVGPSGISGKVVLYVADLDYAKDLRIVYTTDGWKTSQTLPTGNKGEQNKVYFDLNLGGGLQQWAADLSIPGAVQQLQYAIVYRQGVVNGARSYEFWDNNNGSNYVVTAP